MIIYILTVILIVDSIFGNKYWHLTSNVLLTQVFIEIWKMEIHGCTFVGASTHL